MKAIVKLLKVTLYNTRLAIRTPIYEYITIDLSDPDNSQIEIDQKKFIETYILSEIKGFPPPYRIKYEHLLNEVETTLTMYAATQNTEFSTIVLIHSRTLEIIKYLTISRNNINEEIPTNNLTYIIYHFDEENKIWRWVSGSNQLSAK